MEGKILKLSLIWGASLGAIASINLFTFFSFIVLLFLTAPFLMFYSYKKSMPVISKDDKKNALMGGIMGSVACVPFIFVFAVFSWVLMLIFKLPANGLHLFFTFSAFWIFLIFIFMFAIICASTNAVCAMGVKYLLYILNKGK